MSDASATEKLHDLITRFDKTKILHDGMEGQFDIFIPHNPINNATASEQIEALNGIYGILKPEKIKKPYKRAIKFNGYEFNFAVNPEKRLVHGWIHNKPKENPMFLSFDTAITFDICSDMEVVIDGRTYVFDWDKIPQKKKPSHWIETVIHTSPEDTFDPIIGIGVCMLKLISKINYEKSGYKETTKKSNKIKEAFGWNKFKTWLAGE